MGQIGVALALGVLLAAVAVVAEATSPVALELRGERLTLRADGVPLAVVLERLAAATGIAVELKDGGGDDPVSVSVKDVTLEEALQHVLRGRSTLFLYDTDSRALAAVYVLGTRDRGAAAVAVTGPGEASPLAAVVGREDADPDVEPGPAPEMLRISALEAELPPDAPAPFGRAEELLAETDSGVRLTALQHLAARPESAIDALAAALVGHDLIVRSAAQNMLLNREVDEQAVEDVLAVAREGDEAKVRLMLGALLPL